MQEHLQRARELLPAIIITVLSMIQALALELFWNRFQGSQFLWEGGWTAAIGWLQLAVMLLGMLQIWILYVSLMLRFSWLPTMEDTLIPFGIGLLEFTMIDMMGPDHLGPWCISLAAVFAICMFTAHNTHRRARQDPVNHYFFSQVAPATWRDYRASIAVTAILLTLGGILWHTGNQSGLAFASILFGLLALSQQMTLSRHYWMHSLISSGKKPPDGE